MYWEYGLCLRCNMVSIVWISEIPLLILYVTFIVKMADSISCLAGCHGKPA